MTRSQMELAVGERRQFQYAGTERCDRLVEVLGEYAVALMKQEWVRTLGAHYLAQLLQRPGRVRIGGDADIDQATATVLYR